MTRPRSSKFIVSKIRSTLRMLFLAACALGALWLVSGCEGEADEEALDSKGSGGEGVPTQTFIAKHAYVIRSSSIDIQTVNPSTGQLGAPVNHTSGVGGTPRFPTPTPDGRFLYLPNTASNNLSGFAVDGTTGLLTPLAGSPFGTGTNPWAATTDPAGKFLYIANNGGNVTAYTINSSTGALTAISGSITVPSGPIAISVDPAGKFVYVLRSFTPGEVYGYSIDSTTGALTAMPGSPYFAGGNPSAGVVDASGKFYYAANAADDTISGYSINQTTGVLTSLGAPFATGQSPQFIAADPAGKFLFAGTFISGGNNLQVFQINASTGGLTEIAGSPFQPFASLSNKLATIVAVDPSGKFVYVTNANSVNDAVDGFAINSGALTPISGLPTLQPSPRGMAFTRQLQ